MADLAGALLSRDTAQNNVEKALHETMGVWFSECGVSNEAQIELHEFGFNLEFHNDDDNNVILMYDVGL